MVEITESGKTAYFRSAIYRTHLPRTARATNSCTPRWLQGGRRKSSLLTFGTFGHAKVREKKSYFMFLYGGSKPYPVSATPTAFASHMCQFPYHSGSSRRRPLQTKTQVQPTEKAKNIYFIPSALLLYPRPPCTFSGRADNACTNLLGFFV